MRIYKTKNYDEMSRKAANIISAQIILKPESVLGLATGSSPIGTYKQLIEWYNKGDLDFSQIRSINLDEYKGLPADNDQSYAYFMRHNLFDHVNIKSVNTFIPNGMEADVEKECSRYNAIIRSMGGIDLQLLGIGNNGHIGFNEPSDSFAKETHCVDLRPKTPFKPMHVSFPSLRKSRHRHIRPASKTLCRHGTSYSSQAVKPKPMHSMRQFTDRSPRMYRHQSCSYTTRFPSLPMKLHYPASSKKD